MLPRLCPHTSLPPPPAIVPATASLSLAAAASPESGAHPTIEGRIRSFACFRVPLSRAEAVAAAVAAANELLLAAAAAGGAPVTGGATPGGAFGLDLGTGGFLSCVAWPTRRSARAAVLLPPHHLSSLPSSNVAATRSSSAAAQQMRQSCDAASPPRKFPRLARAALLPEESDLTPPPLLLASSPLLRSYAHSHGRIARFSGAFRGIVEGGSAGGASLAAFLQQPLLGGAPVSGGAVDAALQLFQQPALGRVYRGVAQVAAADALPVQWRPASALPPGGLGVQAQQLRGMLSPAQGPRELHAGGSTDGPGDDSLSGNSPALEEATNSASFAGAPQVSGASAG